MQSIWGLFLLGMLLAAAGCSTPHGKTLRAAVDQPYVASDPRFLERAGQLLATTTVAGNHVREYINGDAFFPIMLEAIRSAQHTITLATYIYWRGEVGRHRLPSADQKQH